MRPALFPARSPSARVLLAIIAYAGLSQAACAPSPSRFLVANARAHVAHLAGTIGSRPTGSDRNRLARQYLIDQLVLSGFGVRVQEVHAVRPELGLTAHVSNIIAIKSGARPDAVGLLAHYDSHPAAPGAADDALGVAVCLEAGRVLAARQRPNHALMILLTDGEEPGLMGGAALGADPDVSRRLRAYLNVEAIGSSEPSLLFETGPGHDWLVRTWAVSAPRPRGSSYATEAYKRIPNDTDFTMMKRLGVPGLNFAAVGDGYAYHTARDTPERLSSQTLARLGENVLVIADRLDKTDLDRGGSEDPVFFDVGGRLAFVYSRQSSRLIAFAALLFGVGAWLKLVRQVRHAISWLRLAITAVWAGLGASTIVAVMYLTAWAIRATREAYHPWYAHPRRFLLLLVIVGVLTGRALVRVGRWLPKRVHGVRSAQTTWVVALPVWVVLSIAGERYLPAAAYFWSIPLAVIGALLLVTPVGHPAVLHRVSAVGLFLTAVIWLRQWWDLSLFLVAEMGRLPLVTPLFVYPALIAAPAVMLVPAAMASFGPTMSRAASSPMMTRLLLASLAISGWLTYQAPAYTFHRPLRAAIRFVQDRESALWEIASTEPWLEPPPAADAPRGWQPSSQARTRARLIRPLRLPFRLETAAALQVFPGSLSAAIDEVGSQKELRLHVTAPLSSTVSFVMPPAVRPERASLAGSVRRDRWQADFVAPPADGVSFDARLAGDVDLMETFVIVRTPRLPGGTGWQGLPPWLPADRVVWLAEAVFVEPAGLHLDNGRPGRAQPESVAPGRSLR